jgi:hypothetical protein
LIGLDLIEEEEDYSDTEETPTLMPGINLAREKSFRNPNPNLNGYMRKALESLETRVDTLTQENQALHSFMNRICAKLRMDVADN